MKPEEMPREAKNEIPDEFPLSRQQLYSLIQAEDGLDKMMDVSKSFKELGHALRMEGEKPVKDRHLTIEFTEKDENGFQSALVKNNGDVIYSTSEKLEMEILKLLAEGKDFALSEFMEGDQAESDDEEIDD